MFKSLNDFDFTGRRVLLRADLNVPMRDGRVTDTTRIERLMPTISELLEKGAAVVVMSHFGRPKGRPVADMSLAPVAQALEAACGRPVAFIPDCAGEVAEAAVARLRPGDVALLENLRFHSGEEKNDADFAAELAKLGDIYVNDAFSAAHRAHASTEALARLLPAAAGRNMQAELEALDRALGNPSRPVAAIVGGAKVSTKLDLLENLLARVDVLVIGGGMANTFLFAAGREIGCSLAEKDLVETARAVVAKAEAAGRVLILPTDVVVAPRLEEGVRTRTVSVDTVPGDQMILDFGPQSVAEVVRRLQDCRTVLWNGPLGAFEVPPFDAATVDVARSVAELTRSGRILSVAGGGDTVSALRHAHVADDFTYVSTAGGAFLEWLEGKTLPGVAALEAA